VGGTGRRFYTAWETVGPTPAHVAELPDGIRVAIRTAEPAPSTAEIETAEKTYGNSLPPREQRLLALARFWNTIHYFYGFPENIPNWNNVLSKFIPQFESAATWRDYVFTIARLASETNDSHTWMPEFWRQLGNAPPLAVWPIDGQSVVRDVAQGVQGVERGDIIVAVDGQPVEQRRKFLLDMYPHSTLQGGLLMVNQFLLAGDGPTVKVGIMKSDGKRVNVELARTTLLEFQRTTPIYQVLPSGYGYVDLTRLPEGEVDKAFDSIMDTPGLILDLRGYPDAGFSKYAPRFAQAPAEAALTRRRLWHGPDPAVSSIQSAVEKVMPGDKPRYPRRVVVLIDATAVSRPEYVCLQLEVAANATFIGTPTRGAIGEVTNTVLPGGVQVNFAAEERRRVDGRPVQDVGILPQVWAAPTIPGVREGRDEVLEKAVEFLKLYDEVAKQ
jgi:C-terminal processing protease CtpA/Prc